MVDVKESHVRECDSGFLALHRSEWPINSSGQFEKHSLLAFLPCGSFSRMFMHRYI